mmetsp:Transcript_1433/g.2713  ORF Transcript_1433/g.2713 Transcript_1433/m.2713 type:complete len:227 (-) Transcript_1433:58-738(-)
MRPDLLEVLQIGDDVVRMRPLRSIFAVAALETDQGRVPSALLGGFDVGPAVINDVTQRRVRLSRNFHSQLVALFVMLGEELCCANVDDRMREAPLHAEQLHASRCVLAHRRREHPLVDLDGFDHGLQRRVLLDVRLSLGEVVHGLQKIVQVEFHFLLLQPAQRRPVLLVQLVGLALRHLQLRREIIVDVLRDHLRDLPVIPVQRVVTVDEQCGAFGAATRRLGVSS